MSSKEIAPLLVPWSPETNPKSLKVFGKALEEGGEYVSVVARCLIQGIDEAEPVTGKPNRQWLMEEIADLWATSSLLAAELDLDADFIEERVGKKIEQLEAWYAMPVKE